MISSISNFWNQIPAPIQKGIQLGIIYKVHSLLLNGLMRSFYSLSPEGKLVPKRNLGIELKSIPRPIIIGLGLLDVPTEIFKFPAMLCLGQVATSVLVAPIVEGYYHRYYWQQQFLPKITEQLFPSFNHPAVHIAISTLIFTSVHLFQYQKPMSVLPQFLKGVTYSIIAAKWGLRESILMHAVQNLSALWLNPFKNS